MALKDSPTLRTTLAATLAWGWRLPRSMKLVLLHFNLWKNSELIFLIKRREEIEHEKPVDHYNYLLSLRYLRLQFTHPGISDTHFVTVNMTNVGLWSGDLEVQVLKFGGNQTLNQTLLLICDPDTARFSTVLMNRDADAHVTNQKLNLILQAKKLDVYSTVSLRTNCSLIEDTDEDSLSAGRTAHVSLISILVLFLARFLMS